MASKTDVQDLTTSATEKVAQFVVNWAPAQLPPIALNEARRALIDVLGVALAGSAEESSSIMASIVRQEGAQGGSVVIGHGFRSSASFAALANGTSGHALDFDASATMATSGHPIVCVAPAALAVSDETNAGGRALVEAMIVGYEVIACVGGLGGGEYGDFYRRGYHGTSVFGVFGATAASARLFGLNTEQTRHAFGIALSGAKGVRANYGTMTKPLHAGEASRTGVIAAKLAREGFTANTEIIEARFGWADAVTSNGDRALGLTLGLGDNLAIDQGVNFKQFPSCGSSHPTIRAVLRLVTENDLQPDAIQAIEIVMSRTVASETLIGRWPTNGLEGKFSLEFLVAAAAADRRVAISTFTDAKVKDLDRYRSRISVRGVDGRPPVIARLRTVDGRALICEEPTGKPTMDDPNAQLRRLSEADLREKFRGNVTAVRSAAIAEELLVGLDAIEDAPSVRELSKLLL